MPVPKRKRSRARRDKRFANKGLSVASLTQCQNCKAALATHTACKECGFYKGKKVLVSKVDRALKRAETRKKSAPKEAPTSVEAKPEAE